MAVMEVVAVVAVVVIRQETKPKTMDQTPTFLGAILDGIKPTLANISGYMVHPTISSLSVTIHYKDTITQQPLITPWVDAITIINL